MRGEILDPGFGSNAYRISENSSGNIEILSVRSILKEAKEKGQQPFIVKIDIEGFESELFSRNTEWINEFPILIIELHDWMLPGTGNSRNFVQAVSKLDRDFVFYGENVFSISNSMG